MAATVLLLLFLVFVTACPTSFALHLSPTSAKIAAYPALNRVGGFSNPHLALVTPAPHIQHQGLFERDTSTLATCGYVSGDAGLSIESEHGSVKNQELTCLTFQLRP